jgi:RNA 3'-terminal phosphate cyclase
LREAFATEPRSPASHLLTGNSGKIVMHQFLQTVLPPLLTAPGSSQILISGGTHNKASPPVDFLQRSYLPLIECGSRRGGSMQRHTLLQFHCMSLSVN